MFKTNKTNSLFSVARAILVVLASRKLSILFASLAVLGLVSVAGASTMIVGDAVPLDELIDNPDPLVVGDKEFTDFNYFATGDMPSAEGVNVIPIQDMMGNFGIRFQGAFNDLPGNGPSDSLVTYTVSVADGFPFMISDAHLAGNPNVASDGIGLANVVETFQPTFQGVDISIFDNGASQVQEDWIIFDTQVVTLPVQKNILMNAGTSSGASISFIDQTFSQVVPEPSSLLLILLGSVALIRGRRR